MCPQVIFFTDAVDEYLMQNLTEYDDKKFQNASKDDLKLKGDKAREKKVKETFKSLMTWWKEELGTTAVEAVKVRTSTGLGWDGDGMGVGGDGSGGEGKDGEWDGAALE